MAEQFKIEGLPELKAKLRKVDVETRNKIGFSALRKAAKDVVAAAAKDNAQRIDDPSTRSSIPDAIKVKRDNKHYKRTGSLKISVGVKPTAENPAYHWRFLETGTEYMAARPFMRPSLSENIQETTDTFIREYKRKIDRTLAKAGKK